MKPQKISASNSLEIHVLGVMLTDANTVPVVPSTGLKLSFTRHPEIK
jgi:hypothetical protein